MSMTAGNNGSGYVSCNGDVFYPGYLLISEAQTSDTAKYTCEVSNVAGADTAVARVIVTGRYTQHEGPTVPNKNNQMLGY